ncbi:hypothetical protein PHSC3_000385 [Chlamydiales bacterium STE3]|nr:hypothetical protein PHSC3_000385 [Chlamydiales bacterium STE3]
MKFPIILAVSTQLLALPFFVFAQNEDLSRIDEKPTLFEINRARKWQQKGQYYYYDNPNNPQEGTYQYWQRPNPNSYDFDYPPY